MKDMTDETIRIFGNRSTLVVLLIATAFAMMPVAFAYFAGPSHILTLLWIPFSFITIPPIHILCNRVQGLNARLREVEKALDQVRSAR
jgi:ABC-type Na+ efflux pump permease subunit